MKHRYLSGSVPITMDTQQQTEEKTRRRGWYYQLFYGVVANLACVAPGMTLGFTAVALPQMEAAGSVPMITIEESSWIASLASIATPFGCLISGTLLDRFGRRIALLSLNVPCLVGWFLLACAPTGDAFLAQVYAGRILTGIGTGMASVPATVYLAEVAESSLRGMLVTWTSISISVGICIVYVLGSCFQENWRLVALICAGFPVVACIMAATILPESPVWLYSNGRPEDAKVSLRRVRGVLVHEEMPVYVQNELNAIATNVSQQASRQNQSSWIRNLRKTFLRPETIKPLLIMNTYFFFQQFSGTFVVIVYAVDVVKEAGVVMDGYLTAVLIGATRVVVSIIVSFISNRFGRRAPSIVSGAGMTLCMGTLATYLCLVKPEVNQISPIGWLPVTALLLYIVTSTIGFLTLPWAMIGEVFPSKVRGVAGGITTCMAYIFSFVIVKVYPDMLKALGRDGLFFFYGGVALLGTIFVVVLLPETKGRTLQEIEEYFTGTHRNRAEVSEDALDQGERMLPATHGNAVIVPVQ